jgi:hypothetical protein
VQKNAVILFGDATHILAPFGTYAKDVLHAKTAALVYPSDNAGIAVGAAAIKAGLVQAGISVKAVGYPETQTDLTSVLTAAGAQTADLVIPYSDAAGCVNLAKSLTTLGITNPKKILSAPLCLNGQVIKGRGDFPHWTYSIASSLFGDPSYPGMPAYEEELFGPAAAILRVRDDAEALRVANDTTFGLGGSVWTADAVRGEAIAKKLECGAAFVNAIVKSDPRLPFGGSKRSGFGRELADHGIHEFMNIKTVYVA